MTASSLVENLEKAAEINQELAALVTEARSTMKALRQAERDIRAAIADTKNAVERMIDEAAADRLTGEVNKMVVTINSELDKAGQKTLREFQKIANPLMDAITEIATSQGFEVRKDKTGEFFSAPRTS